MKPLKSVIHLLSVLSILLSACGPVAQPTASEAERTALSSSAHATPSATSLPSMVVSEASTPAPLARVITQRPTPVPAPNCFASPPPANTSKDYVTSIAIADASHIWVSVYAPTNSRTNIYVSDDGGEHWPGGRAFTDFVSKIEASPNFAQDQTVFAAAAGGVYRSLNGGSSWVKITPGGWFTTTPLVRQFAISPNFANDRTILLGSRAAPRGVFASTNGGTTWIDWLVDAVDALFFSPNYAVDRTVWVARNDEQTFRRDVMVTFNQGEQWDFVRAGTAQPFAISPAYAQDSTIIWNDPKSGLFYSRNSDKIFPLLEKAEAEVLKIWQANPQAGWSVVGEARISALVFSPSFAQDRTTFATSDESLIASRDGGASWQPLCYWGFDSQKPDALRFDHLAISPNFASDQTLWAGGSGSRLVVSRDGGKSWTPVALK